MMRDNERRYVIITYHSPLRHVCLPARRARLSYAAFLPVFIFSDRRTTYDARINEGHLQAARERIKAVRDEVANVVKADATSHRFRVRHSLFLRPLRPSPRARVSQIFFFVHVSSLSSARSIKTSRRYRKDVNRDALR